MNYDQLFERYISFLRRGGSDRLMYVIANKRGYFGDDHATAMRIAFDHNN